MWKHLKHYLCIGFTAGLIASLLYVLGVILLAVKATSALVTIESYKVLYQNYFLLAGGLYLLVALYTAAKRETPEMCHCAGKPSHTHCPWVDIVTAIITAVVTYYLLMMVVVPYLTNMLTR